MDEDSGVSESREPEVWPAFTDLFSALSLVFLVLVAVLIALQSGAGGDGPGGDPVMRRELRAALDAISEGGRAFKVQSSGSNISVVLDSLTFPSDSFEEAGLRAQSISAIQRVGRALADTSVRSFYQTIYVIGHTDQVPVSTGSTSARYLDNLELSARRAVTVSRLLLEDSGLDPCRIWATGVGPFFPVTVPAANEKTPLNRRVEIVIAPRLKGVDSSSVAGCLPRGDGPPRPGG